MLRIFSDDIYKRILFYDAPYGIAFVDADGGFIEVNQYFADTVGYSIYELQKKRFQDITHPDDLEGDELMVRAVIVGDLDRYSMVKRYLPKNSGKPIWIKLTVFAVRDENKKFKHFISFIHKLPNGGNFKVENVDGEVQVRPKISIEEFIKDNAFTILKWLIPAIGSFLVGLYYAIKWFVEMLIKN